MSFSCVMLLLSSSPSASEPELLSLQLAEESSGSLCPLGVGLLSGMDDRTYRQTITQTHPQGEMMREDPRKMSVLQLSARVQLTLATNGRMEGRQ